MKFWIGPKGRDIYIGIVKLTDGSTRRLLRVSYAVLNGFGPDTKRFLICFEGPFVWLSGIDEIENGQYVWYPTYHLPEMIQEGRVTIFDRYKEAAASMILAAKMDA